MSRVQGGIATARVVTMAVLGQECQLLYELFRVPAGPCTRGKVRLLGLRVQGLGFKAA